MDRPALQQLLADIQARKVDMLVTYKIDRLTRSLADFAKIVEIFDAKGVSFVSVTQQFNQLPPAPAGGSAGRRAGSKQARVIGLLQRPEGATIDQMATAMGWQRHTVRGLISGALKKKLGLDIVSEKTDRGRFYRISESRSAAR
jgi:hypothetical protein